MELISEENNKKIFVDEEQNEYTMVNVGYYVGSRQRQWYEQANDEWRLMSAKVKQDNGKTVYMSAIIEDSGKYQCLNLSVGNICRELLLRSHFVWSDKIKVKDEEEYLELPNGNKLEMPVVKSYTALERMGREPAIPLNEYVTMPHVFKDEDEIEVFNGEMPSDELLIDFYNKNSELIELINNNTKSR